MSLSELDTLKANFGRPVTANFGWNTDWTDTFSTGLTATYSGSYTTAIKSSSDQRIGIGSECTTCEAVEIFVPKYEATLFDSRIMFALSSRWDYQISQSQSDEFALISATYSMHVAMPLQKETLVLNPVECFG